MRLFLCLALLAGCDDVTNAPRDLAAPSADAAPPDAAPPDAARDAGYYPYCQLSGADGGVCIDRSCARGESCTVDYGYDTDAGRPTASGHCMSGPQGVGVDVFAICCGGIYCVFDKGAPTFCDGHGNCNATAAP